MKRKGRSCKEIEIRDKERQRVYMWKTFLQVFVYLQTSYYAEQDCLRIGRGNSDKNGLSTPATNSLQLFFLSLHDQYGGGGGHLNSTTPIRKPSSISPLPISKLIVPFAFNPKKPCSLHISNSLSKPASTTTASPATTEKFSFSRFAPDQPEKALTSFYARASGLPGVCIATSGPGATNLVSGLADALLDSVPIVAITGQVPRRMIGTDAFQETPIVEVTRSITKHNYLVLDVDDIPRINREAFFLATSGRPGPVLIDNPKDIQQQLAVPNWDVPMKLPGYLSRLPKNPNELHIEQIVRLISERDELSLQMLGMHGTVYANYAVDKSDLLLAFGVRFDDRVTGKLDGFCEQSNRLVALQGINKILESRSTFGEAIPPQYAIQVLDELTDGNAIGVWGRWFLDCLLLLELLRCKILMQLLWILMGDGSFIMNVQKSLATIRVVNLPIKIMLPEQSTFGHGRYSGQESVSSERADEVLFELCGRLKCTHTTCFDISTYFIANVI
ncbi:hypothetical protein NC652_034170 [Populus alba x Populus x berolinensis]|nr:hypothetical protein NC652_034170 [Populus alba x Populus x berolinensis]